MYALCARMPEVIAAMVLEGKKLRTIARILGIPKSTVSSHICAARDLGYLPTYRTKKDLFRIAVDVDGMTTKDAAIHVGIALHNAYTYITQLRRSGDLPPYVKRPKLHPKEPYVPTHIRLRHLKRAKPNATA